MWSWEGQGKVIAVLLPAHACAETPPGVHDGVGCAERRILGRSDNGSLSRLTAARGCVAHNGTFWPVAAPVKAGP
jgi:hypothetical protein